MALDGIFLRHIKKEIEETALGARVNQVYQPNRDELVLVLRTYGGSKKLLLSSRANSPRVNFCVNTPENPAQPPMLCMLLRKRLGGGKLVGVRQLGCDRVLFLDFECVNELGDVEGLSVVCEIMGMYSNLIVINRDSNIIIDAIKRVDLTVSSRRFVLPNIPYELPEAQDKLNILKSLDSLSLSQAELDILASKSSANYFEQKALAHVAKNHGLSYEFAEITPQIACLDEIDRNISTFLYGGSYTTHTPLGDKRSTVPPVEQANDNYDSMRLLSDRAFDRWDKIFNTGYEKGTPKGQAKQYISVLHNNRTPSENGQIIDNMLKTETNEAVKIELIRQIQNDKALKVFIPYTEKPEIFDIKEDEPKVKPGETLTEAAQRRSEVVADEKRKYHAEVEQKASASASESAH